MIAAINDKDYHEMVADRGEKMNEKTEIMALAFDQSPNATGIVLGPYQAGGRTAVRLAHTAKTEQEIVDYLTKMQLVYEEIDLICREQAFIARNHIQGTGIAYMGGFVKGVCMKLWPGAFHVEIHPNKWRSMVHGHNTGSSEYWKEVSLAWAQAHCDIITDHHQADADGIRHAGCQMWFDGKFDE